MVERCDFYSDEEYEGALQDEVEADREQLAKEEESFTDHLINLGYRRGYAKAIEEFAEALKKKYPIAECGFGLINDTLHKNIDEIAEQLKGE